MRVQLLRATWYDAKHACNVLQTVIKAEKRHTFSKRNLLRILQHLLSYAQLRMNTTKTELSTASPASEPSSSELLPCIATVTVHRPANKASW